MNNEQDDHLKETPDKQDVKKENNLSYTALGITFGCAFGIVFGNTLFKNLAIGISIGMCLGLAAGVILDNAKKK